jgi:hypothetical protein
VAKSDDHKKKNPARLDAEHWKTEPDEHDYPAAGDYLSLLCSDEEVHRLVDGLKCAPLVHRKAKDLLRASRLPLLGVDNFHVGEDLEKVRRGERLSPVLLVRGDFTSGVALTVADGYHRICASYHLSENAEIPCRIVEQVQPAGALSPRSTASEPTGEPAEPPVVTRRPAPT